LEACLPACLTFFSLSRPAEPEPEPEPRFVDLGALIEYLIFEKTGRDLATMLPTLHRRFGLCTGDDYVRLALAIQCAHWTEWEVSDSLVMADAAASAASSASSAAPEGAVSGTVVRMANKHNVRQLHLVLMTLSGIAATVCHPLYQAMGDGERKIMMSNLESEFSSVVVKQCLETGVICAGKLRLNAHWAAAEEIFPSSLKISF
jgi:hypothetical protein